MSNILACYQLLELNVISAQDLAPAGRSMRTYAVAWIDPDRKLSTRVDSHGGTDPSWNDKFVFRIDEDFLYDEASTITIDIYAIHWFRDILVGTAHVLVDDAIPQQSSKSFHTNQKPAGMRFMGLQVHRPSGRPKGILNVGVAVLDNSMRSMPLYTHNNTPAVGYHNDHHHNQPSHQATPELRRTKSDTSSMIGSEAMAHEKRAKAKKGKSSSVVTPSEASTKSKKKTSSTLSGSCVKESPKKKGYKLGKTKKNVLADDSPSHFKATPRPLTPKINVGYEVKTSPRMEYQNTPTRTRAYNSTHKGGVRATPLHAFAITNAAMTMEYGTPYRSNMGRQPIMTDSELGPSASEVAAAVARQSLAEEGENSAVGGWSVEESEEGLQPKIERWQTELPPVYDSGEKSSLPISSKKEKNSRRHKDGGSGGGGRNGLFSCFSVICGVECSIVCGGDKKKNRRRRAQSVDNSSLL